MEYNELTNVLYPDRHTVELYQCIYKNAQVGMGSIGKLLEQMDCNKLYDILKGQQKGYTAILRDSANALAQSGVRPIGMRIPEKLNACLMIRLCSLSKNNSLPRIAGMVITGTTMGSIEGAKKKSLCASASEESKALMERLLRFEEANCRTLRAFL